MSLSPTASSSSSPTASSSSTPSQLPYLSSEARRLSSIVAKDVFSADLLHDDQLEKSERLVLMKFKQSPVKPAPLLFVKATGGGKSMVRDVHSVMFRAVSLTIVPILSLGADQCMKMNSRAKQTSDDVVAIHLDEVRSPHQASHIIEKIKSYSMNTNKRMVFFPCHRLSLLVPIGDIFS